MSTLPATSDSSLVRPDVALESLQGPSRFLLAALAYALGVWCGNASSVPPDYIPPVWPANPILLTALLLTPTKQWWGYLLIPLLCDPIWWSATPYPWYLCVLSSVANSIEVFIIAMALRVSGIGIPRFGQLRHVVLFFAITASAVTVVSSIGSLSLWQPGYSLTNWELLRNWALADLLSHLTLAPLLLACATEGRAWFHALSPRRRIEGGILLAGLVPTVLAVYGAADLSLPGVIYLPLPFLLWAALRFGVLGTYAALFTTVALSIWHIAQTAPGASALSPAHAVLAVQSFLIATTLPMAVLTAVLREREEARESLVRYSEGLAAARNEAMSANNAKDEFLGVLSHELRTPLTPILLTASDLEARGDLPDEVYKDLHTIRRSVELEARLIDDLLDVTRIARGKLQLRKEVVDVHTAARQAIQLCCRDQEHVTIRTVLLAEHRHTYVDPARLQQVFWNLLNNALKFTPTGGRITVRVSNPSPDLLRAEVSDTGVGIDPRILPKLFTAFEQGGVSTTRRFGGLGLGLAISRAIARYHGGTLSASSPGLGHGATFTLELPTVPAPPMQPAGPIDRDAAPQRATTARYPLRILLVEDNPQTLRVMTRFLRKLGHHVRPADTEQAALAADRQEPFDLVISDLGLPDGSGHRLMRTLRERHGEVLGIAVSGYGAEEDIRQSREAGFLRHLTKPVSIQQLESVIEQVTV